MGVIKPPQPNYILVVDDTPDNLVLLQMALGRAGYALVSIQDGASALEQIQAYPPELLILDVMMPGMSGYEVTQRIREDLPLSYLPILLITAHESSSVVKGLDLGADDFIRKPIRLDELLARVRSLLRLKHSIDQRENFVSCLTHDLRTPLVATDRILQLIQQGTYGEVTPAIQEMLGHVVRSNGDLLDMLNTLLEVNCYENNKKSLSFTAFNLQQLVADVVTALTPLATAKDLQIQQTWTANPETMVGDRLEIQRVLTNLIGNAIKFTDAGGIEVRATSEGPQIILEVEDSGIGIAPEDQDTLFDRFRQGNHKRSGHGLGLYLCHQIVQAHQGGIEARSQPQQGTVFILRLPTDARVVTVENP